jgi:3-hydroxybutyryl-CoA dehydratase
LRQRYFEDFTLGETFEGPPRTLTDAHFFAFSGLTGDNHPVHYDDEFAANHPFKRRVAHGLLLASMTAVGGTELSAQIHDTVIAFVEQSTRFVAPAFIGDSVRPVFEVIESRHVNRERGLVRLRVTIVRSDGATLVDGEHLYIFRSRASAASPSPS